MSCCDTQINARRNADFRFTYGPSSRKFTFSGMYPRFSVRRGEIELLAVTDAATVNGSSFVVVGDDIVLTVTKEDLALLDSASPDTQSEDLFYDITLTDGSGFENWLLGNAFVLLGINDDSSCNCNGTAEVSLGGQCIEIAIEGGNIAAGASVGLAELNQAVGEAKQAAEDAEAAAQVAATAGSAAGATAGAAAGSAAGDAAGAASGAVAGENAVANIYGITAAQATARNIPSVIGAIFTSGLNTAADGGNGIYQRIGSEPPHAGKFQSADGAWWELSNRDDTTSLSYGTGIAGVQAMISRMGFARIPVGETLVSASVTLDAPLYFNDGAYFNVASGAVLSITATVNSPKQWIFRGAGSVVIPLPDVDSGEDVRELQVIWFGAFTQVDVDQAPAIQRAINSLGNSREGTVWFDEGSYRIDTPMTVGRGVKLSSTSGTRRTVFQITNDGYPVFRTLHTACMFKDLQFENSPTSLTRNFPFIQVDHDFCEITDIFHQSTKNAIIVNGTNCKIRNVEGVYGGATPPAGSSQILVIASGCEIDGVRSRFSSAEGPNAIVEIGTGATAAVTAFYVNNIETLYGSTAVLINCASNSVARGQINNIRYRGSSAATSTVRVVTSGTGSVFGITFNGINSSNLGTGFVSIEQGSSGSISALTFDNIYDAGTSGSAFAVTQTAGTVSDIRVGHNVVTLRANLITTTGAGVSGIRCATPRRLAKTANFTVPASGSEDGALYNVVSASAISATIPAEASEATTFSIASTAAGITTLTAASGATINGAATLALTAGKLYNVAVARNVGGTAAQWVATG